MTTPEPLLSDNESLTLKALLRMSCGIEISLPTDRHSQAAWVAAIFQQLAERHPDLITSMITPLVEARNREVEAWRQRRLYTPRG